MRLVKGRQESKSGWMWDCALTLGGRRGEIRSSILGLHSELEAKPGLYRRSCFKKIKTNKNTNGGQPRDHWKVFLEPGPWSSLMCSF